MSRIGILALVGLLSACSFSPPSSKTEPPSKPLGLLEVTISSAGEASAQWVQANPVSGQAVTVVPVNGTSSLNDVQFQRNSVGTYDDLNTGKRYVNTSFNLTNRTNTEFSNLTLYAVNVPGTTRAGTGVVSIRDVANNLITDESVYRGFQPAHGMTPGGVGGLQVNSTIADLQWFTPAETTSAQSQAITQTIVSDTSTILEYGFVARNLSGGRTIAARDTPTDCTVDACKGLITLTYSFHPNPRQCQSLPLYALFCGCQRV